jgi:transmembrane sensor
VDLNSGMDDRALGWIARLRSDVATEADQQQFALWLAANPEHRAAMDRMLELWDDLGALEHLPAIEQEKPASPSRRLWLGGGLAAAAVFMALVFSPQLMLPQAGEQRYQTGLGEQLVIDLADGSTVTLNTNSRLLVTLETSQRRLELLRGEAFFEVAKDPSRPFVVDVGSARVRALGTAFNIYREGDKSRVTVTEGVVRVTDQRDATATANDSELLYVNQTIATDRNGLSAPDTVDAAPTVAWREGKIIADGMTLAALATQIERYHDRHIIFGSNEVSQLRVSGVFQLNNPDTILRALQQSLDIQVVKIDDRTVQLIL